MMCVLEEYIESSSEDPVQSVPMSAMNCTIYIYIGFSNYFRDDCRH